MSEEELINTYNQKKYDEALKEVEDKEFSLMLENYKKIVQIPFEEYQEKTKEEPKENFQYMVHKMANEDIKIFENLELKDKLIKLQEQEIDKYKQVIDKIKEYIEENKYKKMGGYGNNEDEDIEVCLFEDDIWKLEELLEEIDV